MGHKNIITSVYASSDKKTIISGSIDDTLKIWNINIDSEIKNAPIHTDPVSILCFSSDGKKIGTVSKKKIQIWDS